MAAMMITTMVPTTAFASEADFFADSAEAVSEDANQENWDTSEELFRTISSKTHGKWKAQDIINSNLPIMQ